MEHYVIYDEKNQVQCDVRKYLASLKKNGIKVIAIYDDAILVSDSMKTLLDLNSRNKRAKSIAERTHQIKKLFKEYKEKENKKGKSKTELKLVTT